MYRQLTTFQVPAPRQRIANCGGSPPSSPLLRTLPEIKKCRFLSAGMRAGDVANAIYGRTYRLACLIVALVKLLLRVAVMHAGLQSLVFSRTRSRSTCTIKRTIRESVKAFRSRNLFCMKKSCIRGQSLMIDPVRLCHID